jgi:hypothetical protein
VQEWERNILWEKWKERERLSEQKQEMDTSIRMIKKKYSQKKRKCENTQQGVDKWTNEREI